MARLAAAVVAEAVASGVGAAVALGQQGGGRGTVSELGGRAGGGGGGDGGVQAGTTAMETAAVAVAGATEEEAGAGGLAGGADDVGAHEGTEALGAVAAAKDFNSSRELAALAHEVRPNAGHTGDSIRYQAPGSRAVHLASEAECNICEQCECECAAELHFDPSDEGWYCEECFVEEDSISYSIPIFHFVFHSIFPFTNSRFHGPPLPTSHVRSMSPPTCTTYVVQWGGPGGWFQRT